MGAVAINNLHHEQDTFGNTLFTYLPTDRLIPK